MKVLSFLELINIGWEEEFLHQILHRFNQNTDKEDIAQFYSQPFRPELITELFEGWGCDVEDDSYWFRNNHDKINYARSEMGGYIQYDSTLMNQTFDIPRTLDDFINDCQRAGIELEWRLK